MGPILWRDEAPEQSLEDVMIMYYPWFKSSDSLHPAPKKNKGSLLLGNPRKYSPLARGFPERDKHGPARRRASNPKTSPKTVIRQPISKVEFTTKSDNKLRERTWLQHKIKQYFDKPAKRRLGELPGALVKALWGGTERSRRGNESSDAATDDLIRKLTKLKKKDQEHPECLMDVLLQSWIYFNHSHSKVKAVGNHVHAKYCENAFDHFLLPDGTQVHGSYIISISKLINELRALLARLKAKVIQTDYKVLPTWRPPKLEELEGFALPRFRELPPLYPIEGLLKAPKEDVPANSTPPYFSSPTPIPHPPFIAPHLIKAPVLNLPTMRDFSVERKSIDYSLEHDVPLPTFVATEQLPLPVWEEPEQQPSPPEPQMKEIEILPVPILEPVPPYIAPTAQPRPCEASYYPVSDAMSSICDGLCGNTRNPLTGKTGRCLAKPPIEPSPMAPLPPEIHIHQEPLFEPPIEEPIPEFRPPTLLPGPKYVAPSKPDFPEWSPPPAPDPVGYLAGQRPIFLVECSNTMAGERMKVAQEAVQYLFSRGGQAEIAATHFDIIMYSFDAWSYGAFEEERQYKLTGGPARYWLKNVEVMQPKTPANLDKALTWMSKWQTGGRSNLVKALEVALQRQSSDCIYLFTDGKPERPVILMNMLKKLAKERGKLTPVYTIGLGSSKRGAWFMKNIADATGGKFRELDLKWRSKVTTMEGVAAQDRAWARHMIEEEQRQNLQAGITKNIECILENLRNKFLAEKQGHRNTEYLEEEMKLKEDYRRDSAMNRKENTKAIADAKILHEELTASIEERNREKYDHALGIWEDEVQNVRAFNKQWKKLQDDWEKSVMATENARTKSIEDARKLFTEIVRRIEEKNANQNEQSKQQHDAVVKEIKEKNQKLKRETQARQAEIAVQTEAHNNDMKRHYEERCSEIRALNASLLERARADFSAVCTAINTENRQKLQGAEEEFERVCEEVNAENLRKQNEYKGKLDELDERMKAAIAVHQEQVATIIAEHDAKLTDVAGINTNLEDQAKGEWEEVCHRIDEDNQREMNKALREWETECRAVQQENERLDRRRLELFERAAEVELLNEEIVQKKKQEWKETCDKMELEYQQEVARARLDHEDYVQEVQRRNEETLEAAKVAFSAQLAAVETYNETIRPYVAASKLVQKEMDRINLFLTYIVSKLEMPTFERSPTSRKRTLEQRLDLLSGKDHPCHPRIICEALHVAYAKDVKTGTFPEKPPSTTRFKPDPPIPTKPRSKFEGMVPISPVRVTGHFFDINHTKGREHSAKEFLEKAVIRQQEIAIMIAPMVKARG